MHSFDPELFTREKVSELKETIGKNRALVAISGGVDSTTCAVLVHKAIGKNLLCVMLDDAFMRANEPQHVAKLVSDPPIELPIRILNVQERFLEALNGLTDAEEKRVAFRETFYKTLGETAVDERCSLLVQGTIKADIIETTGGVKTQHNVLQQVGINTMERFGFEVVEPLSSLYKPQVRSVARHLGIPDEIANRQPFPGPGLSVRVVGEIRRDKLESTKKATQVVEEAFEQHNPQQYFVAVLDNQTLSHPRTRRLQETAARSLNVPSRHVSVKVFSARATGVKGNRRRYGGIVGMGAMSADSLLYQPSMKDLAKLQSEVTADPSFTRLLYLVRDTAVKGAYVAALRAITTNDFLTAEVAEIPWETLTKTSEEILRLCKNISTVYYDVTPKPPATIEME